MDIKLLTQLNDSLSSKFTDYVSMIAVGSVVTGDPYIKNRSDIDIVLVFDSNPMAYSETLEDIFNNLKFEPLYKFAPIPRSGWGQLKYAFSNRFRSKTLFGEDLVSSSKLPDADAGRKVYMNGLEDVQHTLFNCTINSGVWTTSTVRDCLWKQFKHAFMYLAIKEYYDTRNYPTTRKEIVERLKSKELNETFHALHSIDTIPKDELIECAKHLNKYISALRD